MANTPQGDISTHIVTRPSDTEVRWREPNVQLHVSMVPTTEGSTSTIEDEVELVLEPTSTSERVSVDTFFDRLQAKHESHTEECQINDSLLASFDPFASKPTTTPLCNPHVSALKQDALSATPPAATSHLISPLVDQTSTPVTTKSSATRLSTGFTPLPSVSIRQTDHPASPTIYSPWMHRSILDQAFGDCGTLSPEWPVSLARTKQLDSVVNETESAPETPVVQPRSHTSVPPTILSTTFADDSSLPVATNNLSELDDLAALLGQVNVQDDAYEDAVKEIPTVLPLHVSQGFEKSSCTPPEQIQTTNIVPGTYKMDKKCATSNLVPEIPAIAVINEVHLGTPVQRLTQPMGSEDLSSSVIHPNKVPTTPRVADLNTSTNVDQPPGRLSIKNLSGMVSQVALSLFDRIGSIAQLTGSTERATPPILQSRRYTAVLESPVVLSPPDDATDTTYNEADVVPTDISCVVVNDPSATPTVPEDGDVWTSVNSTHNTTHSIHVASSQALTTPKYIESAVDEATQDSEDESDGNKENIKISQIGLSTPPQKQSFSYDHVELSKNESHSPCAPVAANRPSLHEKQVSYILDVSRESSLLAHEMTKHPNQSTLEAATATEWYCLMEEICNLRSTIDELSTPLVAYETTVRDSELAERARLLKEATRMFQSVQERNEAMDQASTMYKAFEDCLRRFQRAKEAIETKENKKTVALKTLERYHRRYTQQQEKIQKLSDYSSNHLAKTVSERNQQQETAERSLDKLRVGIRQYEMRNSNLTEQINLLQDQTLELIKVRDQLLQ